MRIYPMLIVCIILIVGGFVSLSQGLGALLGPYVFGNPWIAVGVGLVLLAFGLSLYRGRGCRR
jgi:uncharacterized membrane protein YczE